MRGYPQKSPMKSEENACYEPVYNQDECKWTIRARDNVTQWEERSNECVEYICENESGPVTKSKCVVTDSVCINDKCVKKSSITTGVEVELELDGTDLSQVNTTEMAESISVLFGLPKTDFEVGWESDGDGIIRIIIIVEEQEAERIADLMKTCIKSEDDASSHKMK